MDGLFKAGKEAFQQYSERQSSPNSTHQDARPGGNQFNLTGGAQYNRPAGNQMIDADGDGIPDYQQVAHHANQNAGNSGDASLFENALSFLKSQSNKQSRGHHDDDDDDDINEEKVTQAHDRAYNQGQGGSMDAKSMGMAAALQAFKQFSGNSSNQPSGGSSGGGGSGGQSKLIGMAMAQAAKLFDSSGGASSGQKQDAVNSAGKMVMKLLMKQKMGQMTGGANSGGLSGLASLAGKFM